MIVTDILILDSDEIKMKSEITHNVCCLLPNFAYFLNFLFFLDIWIHFGFATLKL